VDRTLRFSVALSALAILSVSLPTHAQTPATPPPPLILQGLGQATLPLDGPWQFQTGDDPTWSNPALDDSAWLPILAGVPWEAQGHHGYTGFAWYRRRLVVPSTTPASLKLALFLKPCDSACEIYWNGSLVGAIGKLPPNPIWYRSFDEPLGLVVPLGTAQSGVLAIRVWKAPIVFLADAAEGGLTRMPHIGSQEAIASHYTEIRYRWLSSNEFALAITLLSTVAALLAFIAWLRNRRSTVLLWLAITLSFPLEVQLIAGTPGLMPFRWSYGTIGVIISVHDLAAWFLLIALLDLGKSTWLIKWTRIFALSAIAFDLVDSFLMLFDWSRHSGAVLLWGDFLSTVPAVLLETWGIVIVLAAFRRRLDLARWFLAICVLLSDLIIAARDITGLGTRWTHWTINDKIFATIFTIGGSPLAADDIVNTLLLVAILIAAARFILEQNHRQTALEQEYRSAREVQQRLVPVSVPSIPGFDLRAAYLPAQQVGGDFYQIIQQTDGSSLIVLGDVSGKGLIAAMKGVLALGAVRALAESCPTPSRLLNGLNREMVKAADGGFITCLCAQIFPDGRTILSSAGHPAPYLNGEELQIAGGIPLGILASTEYSESTIQILRGQSLMLLSDGVLEATNPAGELFGFDRTAAVSTHSAHQIAAAAQAFGQDDDITVLTLKSVAGAAHA
jgi:serine phosphatase RsbU (regulator of sigma subunit)